MYGTVASVCRSNSTASRAVLSLGRNTVSLRPACHAGGGVPSTSRTVKSTPWMWKLWAYTVFRTSQISRAPAGTTSSTRFMSISRSLISSCPLSLNRRTRAPAGRATGPAPGSRAGSAGASFRLAAALIRRI